MEEIREQPITMPATALNRADEKGAMSEVGSLHDLGKFKSVQALLDAYDNLQVEFTKKCQKLSQLQKDKTKILSEEKDKTLISETDFDKETITENSDNIINNNENLQENHENNDNIGISLQNQEMHKQENMQEFDKHENEEKESFDEDKMTKFLESNFDASSYAEEIKERFKSVKIQNSDPFEVAWAQVLLDHIKEGDKVSDPLINQYVLSDENVKRKVIEGYLTQLRNSNPPIVISSQSGERLSGVKPDSPKSLAEAKRLVDKMFS